MTTTRDDMTPMRVQEIDDNTRDKEPLLVDTHRKTFYPIENRSLYEMYSKQISAFWTVEEVDLSKDPADWNVLTEQEQRFLKYVLAFFATSDTLVNDTLMKTLMTEVNMPEAANFLAAQNFIETVHSEMYSLLLTTYVRDMQEQTELLNSLETIPTVKAKGNWFKAWTDPDYVSFSERIIVQSLMEGVMFSASFASIFWMKSRGLLPGLCFSNEKISQDEGLHADFSVYLHNHEIKHTCTEARIQQIYREGTELEKNFVREALPIRLAGMNSKLMCQYVEYVADFWLRRLNCSPIYNVPNPFEWMDLSSLEGKTNFFEKRVGEYSKPQDLHKGGGRGDNKGVMSIDFNETDW